MTKRILFLSCIVLLSFHSLLSAQNSYSATIDLTPSSDADDKVPTKLKIQSAFTKSDNDQYTISIMAKTDVMDPTIKTEKKYEIFVKGQNIDKDFDKDVFIENIILDLLPDTSSYEHPANIKKAIAAQFDNIIKMVKRDVKRNISNKRVEGAQNTGKPVKEG